MSSLTIRRERPADSEGIRELTALAFAASELGHHGEAELIGELRASCPQWVSLVADIGGRLVGHILFTPVTIQGAGQVVRGMGLAPMAVRPEYQGQGIGSQLVESGLQLLRKEQVPFVVVLGHPEFYSRFGFVPAARFGVTTTFDCVSEEAWMIQILSASAGDVPAGIARFRPEFDSVA